MRDLALRVAVALRWITVPWHRWWIEHHEVALNYHRRWLWDIKRRRHG